MKIWMVLPLLLAGCLEPPKYGPMNQATSALTDLHHWDPQMKGAGQLPYDAVMGWGTDVLPILVDHLTDMNMTAIHEPTFDIQVTVSDVCFLMLLDILQLSWKDFEKDGVWVSTQLSNPIFCIRFDNMAARYKVKAHFAKIVAERDE